MSFRVPGLKLFLLVMLVALGWAAFTGHVWEDYYITYRASKNLAMGHGLTFTVGERVHSFTSPLGVLLPALASLMVGNSSDVMALWIFRMMAAAALAGAVNLLVATVQQQQRTGVMAAGLLVALVLTDAKTIDFTINGMETAFLLLFTAWIWWALVKSPERSWLHLGLAWGAMMWTRPDAFVYIGALALGALLFQPVAGAGWPRVRMVGMFFRAGLLATVIYLPWLLWAWRYYGTPVPHTITAKGLFLPAVTPGVFWDWLVGWPEKMWADSSILAGTFMPAYSLNTGWPHWAGQAAAVVALLAGLLWLVPKLRWEARVTSLAALVGHFYLYSFVGFPIPWYLPVVTFLSIITLSLALAQLAVLEQWGVIRSAARVAGLLLVCATTLLALATAWQLRNQQHIIEDGQRQQIGRWLRSHASSAQDTVFLEPLGYIGYFSNLKMLDYPGLCSPEVVAARRRAESPSYPYCWSELIMDLLPDWLVLRPHERDSILGRDRDVLEKYYDLAKTFDVRDQVAAVSFLPGPGYLTNDAEYAVYHRKRTVPAQVGLKRIKAAQLSRRDSWGQPAYDSGSLLLAHAPSVVEFSLPPGVSALTGGFGFLEGAYNTPPNATDGADFTITFVGSNGARIMLYDRKLRPVSEPTDRGEQRFRVELPSDSMGQLELTIGQGPYGSNAFDWTYWSELTLETPHSW